MEKKQLSIFQIIVRIIFLIAAICAVTYFFPHSETFHYEYELGKPWRYGRLTAPYDFPIYRNDSVIHKMEDSLRMQITPRFVLDTEVSNAMLADMRNKARFSLSPEAYNHLRQLLEGYYAVGILNERDREMLTSTGKQEAHIRIDNHSRAVPVTLIKSEKDIYVEITSDTIFGRQYQRAKVRDFITPSLNPDTAAMNHEYARLRQEVSSTTGVVLADSRIVDQGEIITQAIYDKIHSYSIEHETRRQTSSDETLMLVGQFLLIAIMLSSIMIFLYLYRPWIYVRQTETLVAVGSVTFMTILTAITSNNLINGAYLVPIGIVTIVLATFMGSRTAYYCHIIMALLCSFMAPSHFEYLVIQSIVGIVIIFNLKNGLEDRNQLLRVSILTGISYCTCYAAYLLANEGTLVNISIKTIGFLCCNALLLLMSYVIIYAFEKLFHFMSGVTLVELCNLNVGLLDRLSKEAPGTFEHSMHVSNLAANAAKAIKANAQLVRTGALYHDIGKLWNPIYYTENQKGVNPHDNFTIEQSVEVIKRHVTEGLSLAKKAKLPVEIQEFIMCHHGRSVIKFFYNTWCNQHPNEEPDMELFTYQGEDPKTKEQAILMMCDSVEAASKSLNETTEESISNLVNKIIDSIVTSGRLNNSKITLREIKIVKLSFIKDLMGIYHTRIAYPELKK